MKFIDTTQKNLLKSLDADIYDCVISSVGMTEENCEKYEATNAYADVSAIEDELTEKPKNTKIAIFGKKNNGLIQAIRKTGIRAVKRGWNTFRNSNQYSGYRCYSKIKYSKIKI